jgi:DNA polymerase I-like protein with 3'-5' exonuclease and polymerase domains
MLVGVFDVEANGFLEDATQSWCIVVKCIAAPEGKSEDTVGATYKYDPNHIDSALDHMSEYDVLIGHNSIAYDLPLLEKLYGWTFKGKVVDTLLMSRLQRPNLKVPFNCPNKGARPHSLEAWGYRVGRGKPEHDDWHQYSEEMLHRCSEDVEITHLVYKELLKDGAKFREANMLTFRLFHILRKQEERGWLADREALDNGIHMLNHWIGRIDRVLMPRLPQVLEIQEAKENGKYKCVNKPYNKDGTPSLSLRNWLDSLDGTSVDHDVRGPFSRVLFRTVDLDKSSETKEHLLREGWIPDKWNVNAAGERTSPKLSKDDPFIGLTSSIGSLIVKRVQCKQRRGIMEGWRDKLRPDGTLATPVSQLAVTRRCKHKVVVNVPGSDAFFGKTMRKVFTARPGYVIVGIDSAGCQNRMLGARVGNPEYLHTLVYGKKEEGTAIHQLNQAAIEAEIGMPITYRHAKNLNYAFLFGARDPKLGATINQSKEVGAKVRKAMLGAAPGFEELLDKLTEEWKSNAKTRPGKWGVEYYDGWIAGLDGCPIFIPYEYMILVYMLQSDEAIMMARAYVMMYDRMTERGYQWGEDWAYLIYYHDEYNIECRPEIAEEVAKLGEQCIADAGEYYNIACPHEGEAIIGGNWYEVH